MAIQMGSSTTQDGRATFFVFTSLFFLVLLTSSVKSAPAPAINNPVYTGSGLNPMSPYYGIGGGWLDTPWDSKKLDDEMNALRDAARGRADAYEVNWERNFRQAKKDFAKVRQEQENMNHPLGIIGDLFNMTPVGALGKKISDKYLGGGGTGILGLGYLIGAAGEDTDETEGYTGMGKKFGPGMTGYGLFGKFERK